VAKRIISFVENSEYQLVETLAENIAEILLDEFNVPWLRLTLNKQGAVRGVRDVGVIIERNKKK
jgi:7,8-dihydroneopterin aldolase/epimerase/oxygenase